jgi:predicted RNA-binding Zn-ribbon protein involved in translation (DUF1610 family)
MNPEKNPPGATEGGCIRIRKHPEAGCPDCGKFQLSYWCDICQQEVPEKRCPFCGLKARKMRQLTEG